MPTMQQTTTQRKNNTMQNRLVASRKFETDSDINRQNILIRTFISASQSNLDLPDNMFDTLIWLSHSDEEKKDILDKELEEYFN